MRLSLHYLAKDVWCMASIENIGDPDPMLTVVFSEVLPKVLLDSIVIQGLFCLVISFLAGLVI